MTRCGRYSGVTSLKSLVSAEIPNSPRPIFRIADENRLLAAGVEQWELYIRTRIDTTHDYDEGKAARAIGVMTDFIDDATRLYTGYDR